MSEILASSSNMDLPDFNPSNSDVQWDRFGKLLWFNDHLGFWLDISRMDINKNDFEKLRPAFDKAFVAIKALEEGSIANQDEKRMVGHYWLRTPSISPTIEISNLINNETEKIKEFSKSILSGEIKTDKGFDFTDVLWIGIGGSSLGPILLVESLQELNQGLSFHFLDNVDTFGISKTIKSLGHRLSSTLFVVVSKSGGTPEPQICMDQARFHLEKAGYDWSSRAVAITMKNSALDQKACNEKWLRRFDLPDWVGGRTSITSAVGLLPISLVGADVNKFLAGASKMDEVTRSPHMSSNPAALLASAWYSSGKAKGLKDMVLLPYSDSLEVFSKYLQQLVMESLGKRLDRQGNIVNQGIAVYGNKGSTDQHAYVQQLRDGIDNFFTTFIEVLADNDLPEINDRLPGDFLSGFLQGTRLALTESNRQSITITIREFNEYSLGALIALFERAVGLYAELIDINAYHQPGVEAGKKAAAQVLLLQNNIETLISDKNIHTVDSISESLDNSSKESVYNILRKLLRDNHNYEINGSWGDPSTLEFRRIK